MKKEGLCEICENYFDCYDRNGLRKSRFCSKECLNFWRAKNCLFLNKKSFQWKNCTEEEKLERIRKRFEEKVIKQEGCWDWKGYFDKDGYTLLSSGANGKGFKERRGHRISWLLYKGEIPKNIIICHSCDNPSCTNPDHLFLGSIKDNNRDSFKKGRAAVGSKQPKAKLSEEDVVKIRELLKMGVKSIRIAKDFGVSPSQICAINKGKSWKHC